jgi:L-histidine Nalpha-methyltransferase / hercynylcysteine S-oxide synthase
MSRALRKTSVILDAMASQAHTNTPLTYYALDLEEKELQRTLEELDASIGKVLYGKVDTKGLSGTYEDGIRWVLEGGLNHKAAPLTRRDAEVRVKPSVRDSSPVSSGSGDDSSDALSSPTTAPSTPDESHAPVHMMFLGSSLGNFSRGEDVAFLRSLPLRRGSGDTLLIGLDQDNDANIIELAYNDPKGHTKAFIMNGLVAAGRELGDRTIFAEDKWTYVNRYDPERREFSHDCIDLF